MTFKVKHVALVKVNLLEASFWLIRKGTIQQVGKPVKTFDPDRIGVLVVSENINPQYYFHVFQYWHQAGVFSQMAHGTLELKHIRVSDVKELPMMPERK